MIIHNIRDDRTHDTNTDHTHHFVHMTSASTTELAHTQTLSKLYTDTVRHAMNRERQRHQEIN